jgi:hypothetical protein
MTSTTQSTVLAGRPLAGDCCVKGVEHFGEPSGETITIAGIQTYTPKHLPPKDSSSHVDNLDKKIILYFADVFGLFYINAQFESVVAGLLCLAWFVAI